MYILAISNGYVATATLLKDGKVIACASEERFNNIKNYNGFPKQAIEWCLSYAGISGRDLDLVTTPYLYRPPIHAPIEQKKEFASLSLIAQFSQVINYVRSYYRILRFYFPIIRPIGYFGYRLASRLVGSYYTDKQKEFISQFLGIPQERVVAFDHHLSHGAAAYYASPFNQEKALVLTLDGEGDNYCASVNIFHNDSIEVIAKTPREASIGYLYGIATKFLGMKPHEHEYKVMGLAPYARSEDIDRVYQRIKDTIWLDPDNPLLFKTVCNAQDFERWLHQNLLNTRFDFVAGAFQRLVEERLIEWIHAAIKQTNIHTVVLSGGVFMNVKANGRIALQKEIKKLYILPSCADESAPLGSAYMGYMHLRSHQPELAYPEPISDIYWGPSFDDTAITAALKKYKHFHSKRYSKIEPVIAKILSQGGIVANMSGRMEFGARALGNRSIWANPQDPKVIRVINDQIKGRDFWMPFAPSILAERADDYMKNPKKLVSPYMMLAFESTELAQRELIGALHPYDFTLRPQIVTEQLNSRYYKVLKEFERLTGIGGVLNTSFNLHGYPIVIGPEEALNVLARSGLEYLVLENYLISKKKITF